MPFGLQGAPASFQHLMDIVLAGTAAHPAGGADHPPAQVCNSPGGGEVPWPYSRPGCDLATKDKVQAVQECQRPKTLKDVRSFLGLMGWYHRIVADFARRAAPVTDLTRKSGFAEIQWRKEKERAFLDLKGALCKDPVLQSPDFEQH